MLDGNSADGKTFYQDFMSEVSVICRADFVVGVQNTNLAAFLKSWVHVMDHDISDSSCGVKWLHLTPASSSFLRSIQ